MAELSKTRIVRGPFRGAKVYLDKSNSRRKIYGLYEHVLNKWLEEKIGLHDTFIDVGANNGYHTFGFAHAALRSGKVPYVIAVEPDDLKELEEPRSWPEYAGCKIEIINKFCSNKTAENEIALGDIVTPLDGGLIKIDIEGHESEVMQGAAALVDDARFDWCIEIHGDERIPEIASYFCEAKRPFLIFDLRKLPFLKPEPRTLHTTWLVTI